MNAAAPIAITPVFVADLHVEGERMPVYVHVIDHPDGRVLVDTGMTELHPLMADMDPRLHPLSEQDFDLAGIDIVVNTHLHADHCGGNHLFAGRPIYVQRRELDDARSEDEYLREWVEAPGVRYTPVDGELELLPGLRLVPAPGHTRGMQVVVVETGGRPVVVGGDVAVWFGELDEPDTEGQLRVRALDPELVWLAHEHEPWRPAPSKGPSQEFQGPTRRHDPLATRRARHLSHHTGRPALTNIATFSAMTASVPLPQLSLLPVGDGPRDVRATLPAVLLFAHADCPTSLLTLRRLAGRPDGVVLVAEEDPAEAARLARRTGLDVPIFAQPSPYEASHALGVEAVPTALRVSAEGEVEERVVGWDREAYERMLGVELPPDKPSWMPACSSRSVYDWSGGEGLDELEDMFERGWTDGLPVVPPTPERVEAMLGGRDPSRSLGHVPPALGEATLERVAACAVLAGCRPEYFPVVLAAVEAALEPALNLNGQAVTTQPAGQVIVVNGPIRDVLGLNSEIGALGPGARANMTVGRALRLVVALTGGGYPGRLDRATLGHPGKVSFCIAENEEASPWEPLHVERGLQAGSSAVTLVAADAPLSISDHRSRTPEQLAMTLGWAAATSWSPYWWPLEADSLFVVCPEHSDLFRAHGWEKARVREAMYAAVHRPAVELRGQGETTARVLGAPPDEEIPRWDDPARILLVVAGGPAGRFSAVLGPCLGMDAVVVTKEVEWNT